MKDWFKYKYGFVNIDSENIYFTNSGNWSEVDGLEEKILKTKLASMGRKAKILVFLVLVGILFTFLVTKNISSGRFSLLLIIGLPVLAYYAYEYLKVEMGSKYLIPLINLTKIEIEERSIHIYFLNGNNKEDYEMLEGVDEKGILLIADLIEIRKIG